MSAAPAKDKKQVIVVSIFGALLLLFVIYAYNAFFGGSSAPPPAPAATVAPAPVKTSSSTRSESSANGTRTSVAAGVAATKMASTSSSLDPTLDESAMLRTESLVYSGSGRNIFSAIYVPPVVIPTNMPKARPGPIAPPVPTGPPPPPPPPPINLKFFGTAVRANGLRQAFLLNGEDVYLASAGDIVARKYKIVSIGTNSIQVEDLQNANTQTLPLQAN
jgi:hypothetical protein